MTRECSCRYADVRPWGAIEGRELLTFVSFVNGSEIMWHSGCPVGLMGMMPKYTGNFCLCLLLGFPIANTGPEPCSGWKVPKVILPLHSSIYTIIGKTAGFPMEVGWEGCCFLMVLYGALHAIWLYPTYIPFSNSLGDLEQVSLIPPITEHRTYARYV
jgi:hypothetical protein